MRSFSFRITRNTWQQEGRAVIFSSVLLIKAVRYAITSAHIRIIQVTSIHKLLEKYKNPLKQQRETRTKTNSSPSKIRINLT